MRFALQEVFSYSEDNLFLDLLFLRLGSPNGEHALTFHFGHTFQNAHLIEALGEFQQ